MLETDTSHARVYLDVAAYRSGGVLRESLRVLGRDHALYDVVHRYLVGVFGRSIAEYKYLRVGSVVPHGDSLVEIGHRKMRYAAVLREGADDVGVSVTVCVSLHDCHYLCRRRVEPLDYFHIFPQLRE